MILNYKEAHALQSRRFGAFWEGWNLCFHTQTPHGFTSKNGMYRNGRWGIKTVVPVSNDGTWNVPARFAGKV